MKKIWDLIVHGYINTHTDEHTTGKISIKLLVLLIGVIIGLQILSNLGG